MTGRSLVTGGAGFVGRHLVAQLLERGETVRVLDRTIGPPALLEDVESIEGSVTDSKTVARAMHGVESVFHLAAQTQLWARNRGSFVEINVEGTRQVMAQARAAGVQRVVHVSSIVTLIGKSTPRTGTTVSAESRLPASEMLGPYPRSKRQGEEIALAAACEGLQAIAVLPAVPVGPGDVNMTPPTRMLQQLLNGDLPAVLDCMLNLIDVRALARGLIAARDHGDAGHCYVLAGEDLRMAEFLARLERLTRLPMPKRRVPYPVALAAATVSEAMASVTGKPPSAPLTGVRLAGRPVWLDANAAQVDLGV
ncbi:MAG TPA: NAD-dependent epimerase/dehydratase family protein, partial [Alphaproteobacteria bacterium]|nr:NAD-dependent epimerase/dehydratase family protein [Alphaproteobacteria bacterium]